MKAQFKTKLIIGVIIVLGLMMTWMMGEKPSKEVVSTPYQAENQIDEKGVDSVTGTSGEIDEYMTNPVPEGKPGPVEPQDVMIDEKQSFKVSLSVSSHTILNNMDLLDESKHGLVPEDGIIFPLTEVVVYEGESVFDVLLREMMNAKIHMEYVNTPIYNSAYIEGINNLYEFDAGELSGWMYKVNGWFPNYGCSRYQLQPGDIVEWVYTCDLGRDVGETTLDSK